MFKDWNLSASKSIIYFKIKLIVQDLNMPWNLIGIVFDF